MLHYNISLIENNFINSIIINKANMSFFYFNKMYCLFYQYLAYYWINEIIFN